MSGKNILIFLMLFILSFIVSVDFLYGYSANKVWFEFRDNGRFRVYVNYTVPDLREFRESYVDFHKKKEAEKFFWNLVRGADFFPSDPKSLRFTNPTGRPVPW